MAVLNYLKDTSFLETLIKERVKTLYIKIIVLDKNEIPIQSIEGRVTAGNVNLSGDSSMRRTGSVTMVADEKEDLSVTNVNHLLSMNKKIKISIGIDNKINSFYDNIIWFPLGVFVITQPNISHSLSGVNINLNFQDKMCLLNGECGGGLPASIIFHEYDQIIGSVEFDDKDGFPKDVNNYTVYIQKKDNEIVDYWRWNNEKGWEKSSADAIGSTETLPQRIFDIIRTLVINYGGEDPAKVIINDVALELKSLVRYVGSNSIYYLESLGYYSLSEKDPVFKGYENEVKVFNYNEDIGYVYTDFTYPGELISGIGESVTSVLDKIRDTLGNYEYFYDIDGNFIFQEIKNYLNTSHATDVLEQGSILNNGTYKADFNNSNKTVFTFEEGSELITSYSNTPNYLNIKNDFHIWGESDDNRVIHYHIAIKEQPKVMNSYNVVYEGETGIRLAKNGEASQTYVPTDWRAELYLQGMVKRDLGQRPNIYEQELLDYFDSIYNFQAKQYKIDIVGKPNSLSYYIDFLEPTGQLHDFSVESIGPRVHSYQQDNINRLYNTDVPNNILINVEFNDKTQNSIVDKCKTEGQSFSNVSEVIYDSVAIGTSGYTAQDTARSLLYQHTNYNEQISLQCIPIYYLDVNTRISIYDKAADIYGDYIVNSISLPLDINGQMSISASRAQDRELSQTIKPLDINNVYLLSDDGFILTDKNRVFIMAKEDKKENGDRT